LKLTDIFFESLKITWKNKPMWKFNFFIFIPIFLVSLFLYIVPIIMISLEENGLNPIYLGRNGETILNVLMIITTLLYLGVYLGGLIAIQLGANIQCWQECAGESIARKNGLFKSILRKILPSLPNYLAFVILPYFVITALLVGFIFLVEVTGEPVLMLFMFLFVFAILFIFYVGVYLTFIFIPVTAHENTSFKKRMQLAWMYLRNHFWDVFVYALIVGIFDIVVNTIIYISYMMIYVILYIPSIMLLMQGDEAIFFIAFAVFMLIMLVVAVLITAIKNLIITAKQTAFTRFYYQKYSLSEEMQKIAPLSPPVLLEE
jgi:hypothetical protein